MIALVVRIRIGSPVLFRQSRPGLKGQPFTMYKFRTMSDNRDGNGKLLSDALRLSKLGRFLRAASLDELPELFNVLKGEMSLVGPRPLLMEYLGRYSEVDAHRHDVLPGITGWAQVNGRNSLEWKQKFALDIWYVENQSLGLDFKILFKTIFKVFMSDGISSDHHATMSEFKSPLIVIGAGGHAKVVISAIQALGLDVSEVYDDDPAKWGTAIQGVPVIGALELLKSKKGVRAVIGVGNNLIRKKISEMFDVSWQTVIHPRAIVHPSVKIGAGVVVFAGAVIQPDSILGAHCIVNTSAIVDHDCILGDFVHVGPGVNICGGVSVGTGTLLGVGTSVIPSLEIGSWATVGAGSAVVHDVHSNVTVLGSPARPVPRALPASPGIPMASAELDESDVQGVVEVIRSGRLALGPKVPAFEKSIADYVGVKHAVAVSSGTAALHLIIKSMGIGPGDEVLVPSFTFAASVNAILFEGGTPVFVDADPLTYNIDPVDMARKAGPKTKAVMVVDIFGHPVPWTEISDISEKLGLRIIDDSCEALGAKYRGQSIGSLGDAAAFAFYPNKQITTGEGGMLVTNDDEIARLARSYRNQGRNEMGHWLEHARLGYNYRMDEMSGALGCSQMARLDRFLEKRSRVADLYTQRLCGLDWVRPPVILPHVKMSWFVYVVSLEVDRDRVIRELESRGIPARAYFSPIHEQAYLMTVKTRGQDHLPVTNLVAKKTLALPFFNDMSVEQVDRVVHALKEVVASLKRQDRAA